MSKKLPENKKCTISIIGLGYVGLPLIIEFAKKKQNLSCEEASERRLIGFDINKNRIKELKKNNDITNEVSQEELINSQNILFTSDLEDLIETEVYIVTVPTPIDKAKKPNLRPLMNACSDIGYLLKKRSESLSARKTNTKPIIIFESTVYPGATEEVCVPIIETESGLEFDSDFHVGYSPERINPGDKKHRLSDIIKITSGSTKDCAEWIDNLYASIIQAGTYKCESIKVAEAAKVIENTQRDLNIALINELSIIFKKLNIDTLDVLEAASTKWNFINFKPGLVGGHCIGVDPYYLTYKAQQINYEPQIVLAGRRINDMMSNWVVSQLIKAMAKKAIPIGNANVLVVGLSFKENCPDVRNTKVVDIVSKLKEYNINPFIYDPIADKSETKRLYSIELESEIPNSIDFSAAIIAVSHNIFKDKNKYDWQKIINKKGLIFDLKGILEKKENHIRP